jgi:DnaD/phage-associated family protein
MNGFQSPNYTQTPNDLFDELLPEMGLAELKVMLCIVRYTFGYHREEAELSLRAIARFTGLTVKSVMEGATQGEAHGLIERYQDGQKTTKWRAIVTVIPSITPRSSRYNRTVLPSNTQSGLKKEIKVKQTEEDGVRQAKQANQDISARLFKSYESEIGIITPFIADAIEDALISAIPAKWIEDSFREAAAQNKRSWKYCEAILKRWKAQGNQNPVEKPAYQPKGNKSNANTSTGYQVPQYTQDDYDLAAQIRAERDLS